MKRRAPFSISNALSALKRGKASDADGLLLPTDIIKKILACLPARECWRIGTQLSKQFNQWTKSVINIYTCYVEEWILKHIPMHRLNYVEIEIRARYKWDFKRIEFSFPRDEQHPIYDVTQVNLTRTIMENNASLEEIVPLIGDRSQSRVLYTFEKNVTLSAKINFQ